MAAAAFSYRSNNASSDSDSDDSDKECSDWKRASGRMSKTENLEKIPIDPPVISSNPTPSDNSVLTGAKRKRNNIWSDVLEDQMMSETLNHCGIKNKPKGYGSRGEESYDYTLSYKYQKKDSDSDDKMSEDDSSEKNSVSSNTNHKDFRTLINKIPFVKLDRAGLNATRKILKILCEPKKYLIYRVVKFAGIEKALELLKKTEDIEENGGMMIKNQQRRRTPGGVYFQLLKADKNIEKATIDKIFEGEISSYDRKKIFDERKKNKKLKAAKEALLKKFSLEMKNCQEVSVESKMDEDSMVVEESKMEKGPVVEESTMEKDPVVEESTMEKDPILQEESAETLDLEDGEIAD
ncbi:RNA_GG_bind domain-containing protein [Trichonephila inaurata madagascariensis]|uniref:Phosphorylated adapter RNA export protein n=1 Tax=Trichonephila inaurata madagascariensis TaxID=2747483 RepID=A0A8X6X7R9_9ARAC|nr:RNA_GG_bind domain-containing protein [Trichonephila inaurata madagascariensis]